MSILMATPLAVGNAIRLTLEVPAGATRTRILRRELDFIAGPFDTDAKLVIDGDIRGSAIDVYCVNGTQYWYRPYHLIDGDWVEGAGATAIPQASYVDHSVDPQTVLRERLVAGLAVELARGTFRHERGEVPVLLAPPRFDDVVMPAVTVQHNRDAPGERYLGEAPGDDVPTPGGDWLELEGWQASVSVTIGVFSLNPDERLVLRKAVRRILVANLAVFDALGLTGVTPDFGDSEDYESYSAPVYISTCTFTCTAPVAVGGEVNAIEDVTVTVREELTP